MKLVCKEGNIADEGSYWCRHCERGCAPRQLSLLFEHGEKLDAVEIVALLRIFPTATLYRARRGNRNVLVKVAHQGFEQQLKAEANLLHQLTAHAAFPDILPIDERQPRLYGKFTVREQTTYYLILKDMQGVFLRDMLNQHPQPPLLDATWLTIGIGEALRVLHEDYHQVHLGLNPNAILVQHSSEDVPRPILLDFGNLTPIANRPVSMVVSSYMPPEQVEKGKCTLTADVYTLAAIFYEMTAGQPIFSSNFQTDEVLRAMIVNTEPIPLKQRRPELSSRITLSITQALEKRASARQATIKAMLIPLRDIFGDVPLSTPKLRGFLQGIDPRLLAIVIFGLLLIMLFLIVIISITYG